MICEFEDEVACKNDAAFLITSNEGKRKDESRCFCAEHTKIIDEINGRRAVIATDRRLPARYKVVAL